MPRSKVFERGIFSNYDKLIGNFSKVFWSAHGIIYTESHEIKTLRRCRLRAGARSALLTAA